jgi:hypothetical protein
MPIPRTLLPRTFDLHVRSTCSRATYGGHSGSTWNSQIKIILIRVFRVCSLCRGILQFRRIYIVQLERIGTDGACKADVKR